jgi:hypothetical protein
MAAAHGPPSASPVRRLALDLRADPGRVVVRPFRPATEPRDLNPADKARANRIVGRVMALDPAAAAGHLADVLESFGDRHRNLLATCEARADDMEDAFAEHAAFSRVQRQLVGAYFLLEYSYEASARCAAMRSARPCWTSTIPRVCLPARASR